MKLKNYLLACFVFCQFISFGQVVVDQAHIPVTTGQGNVLIDSGQNGGQSFTAGVTGLLVQVGVEHSANTNFPFQPGDFRLTIYAGEGYNGAVLGTQDFTKSTQPPNNELDIPISTPISISSGSVYTIKIEGLNTGLMTLVSKTFSDYDDGQFYRGNSQADGFRDLWFRTFVQLPVDATHLNFDGIDDNITLPATALNNLSQGTIESWIYLNNLDNQTICAKQSNFENSYAIFSVGGGSASNGQLFYQAKNGSNFTSTASLSIGQWYHVAVTFDNTGASMYIDGILDNTASGDFSMPNDTSVTATALGAWLGDGGGQYLNGNIEEFRVWNTARTVAQINGSKDCELQGNEASLVTYYQFNQGSGSVNNSGESTLLDAASNNFNGTLTNFALVGSTSNWLAGSPVTTGSTIPAAPTVSNQSFCEASTVANLIPATSATINWYASATSTTVLNSSDALVNGNTYYVTAINTNGCESDRVGVTVTISDLSGAIDSQTNVLCFEENTGSVTVSASGGSGSYTYLWSNTQANATANNLTAGVYTCTITDTTTGCTADVMATITEPGTALSVFITSSTNVSCNGDSDGSATATTVGGIPPYVYSWNNGDTTTTIDNLSAGTYTVSVTDQSGAGCTVQTSVIITEPAVLANPTVNSPVVYNQGDTASPLTATSSGDGLLWYVASTGGTGSTTAATPDTSIAGNTSYWVSSTNIEGCESAREEIVVTINEVIIDAPTTNFAVQIYTGDDKTLADLQVIGDNIIWYDAVSAGNILPSSNLLVDNTTYYTSQTIGGVESTERLAITVNRISDNRQALSPGSTVADLAATPSLETSDQWFTTPTGGTKLTEATLLTSGTYYVEQFGRVVETVAIGFNLPQDIALTSDGKILVADTNNNVIKRIDADGTNIEILGSGFSSPRNVTVESDGKILVYDYGNNAIKRMDADGNNSNTINTSIVAFDLTTQLDGKIIASGFGLGAGNNVIKRMDADGTNEENLVNNASSIQGVAEQSDGKIVFANSGNGSIERIDADGSNRVTLATGFSSPHGVFIRSDGKILVADTGNNVVKLMDSDGTNITVLTPVFSVPVSVVEESNGDILVLERTSGMIKRIAIAKASNRVPVTINLVTSPPKAAYTTHVYTGDDKTLTDLQVDGTDIKWYDAETSGNLLSLSSILVDDTTYYASQTVGGLESTIRLGITVNRISDNTQSIALNATVADLVATPSTGFTAQWFTMASDGTSLESTAALSAGTYYVEQIKYETTITTLGNGFNNPFGIALEADGKILVGDLDNNVIKRMDADGTNSVVLRSGVKATSIVVEANGKIVFSDLGDNNIKRIDADGSNIQTIGSVDAGYGSLALQPDGKILYVDLDSSPNGHVKRMNQDGTNIETLGNDIFLPSAVTVLSNGKILVGSPIHGIYSMDADGSNQTRLPNNAFNSPIAIIEDTDGSILVLDQGGSTLSRMDADGTNTTTLASGFSIPSGMALESGTILVADSGNDVVKRVSLSIGSNRVPVNLTIALPDAPTTAYPIQVYTGDDKTLADLQVTGNNIQWYDAEVNGNSFINSTLLVDETTYYASQTVNGTESTQRVAVSVNRISDNAQFLEVDSTVGDLITTPSPGAITEWFYNATGGIAIENTELLFNSTYYVEQFVPGAISPLVTISGSTQGIAIQSDGKILVTDVNANTILRMNADGTGVETIVSGFNFPEDVAVEADGRILIVDSDGVKRMNADGSNIETLGGGFGSCFGVAVQADGKILVADTNNSEIKRMDADGTNIETLGSGFAFPTGVVIQTDGKILVADRGNNSIKRMDADGSNIESLGSGFSFPSKVAIQTDGKILISDSNNNLVKRMDADGSNLEVIGNGFDFNNGIAVKSDGTILVVDTSTGEIMQIINPISMFSNRVPVTVNLVTEAPTTNFTTQIYTGDDKTLAELQVTGDNIQWYDAEVDGNSLMSSTLLVDETTYYASQTVGGLESTERVAIMVNRISDNTQTLASGSIVADLVTTPNEGTLAQWFDADTGGNLLANSTLLTSGTYYVEQSVFGSSPSTFASLSGSTKDIAIQTDGKVLIADTSDNTIKRIDADGTNLVTVASGFNSPNGIAVQLDGKILVADNDGIKRIDSDGSNIETLGNGFSRPSDVTVQSDGKILIADEFASEIKRMDTDGSNIEVLGSGFGYPSGIAVQSDGKILIADTGSNSIKRMDADGINIVTLGTGFSSPSKIAVQFNGKIIITDTDNNAVKRMNADGSNIGTLLSGFNFNGGVAIQADGKVLAFDADSGIIIQLTPSIAASNRVTVVVDFTLSINDFQNSEIAIYPNPSTGIFNINTKETVDLKIYDITGKLVHAKALDSGLTALDITHLQVGTYILKAKNQEGAIKNYKLIKQ